MIAPYYESDGITLYHGDCLDILPTLDVTADVLLTDPPYFKVKEDEWDNQWAKAGDFLAWLGGFLDTAKPLLAAHASVWVFASPAMTSSVERLVGERFRTLNSIRWLKPSGAHNRSDVRALRSYTSAWEGLILAEQLSDGYASHDYESRKSVFVAVGGHLAEARTATGLTRNDVTPHLVGLYRNAHTANAMLGAWEIGLKSVTPAAHAILSALYGGRLRDYDDLRVEYESLLNKFQDLRRQYENLRRPFNLTQYAQSSDVWTYERVRSSPGRHPCEKPGPMLRHMLEVSSRPGQLILDPFAGSGSTLVAAREMGRRAVGVELDERYCEMAARRLGQRALNFESAS